MSKLNDNDCQRQIDNDNCSNENDRFYGWELDVSDTWYLIDMPKTLNDRDSYYADSSWRFF